MEKARINQEIALRNQADKNYVKRSDFALRTIMLHEQLLGLRENAFSKSEKNDHKEVLSTYRQVVLNDTKGHIIEKENQEKVAKSLENSYSSIGYPTLLEKALTDLVPKDSNSFLVIPQSIRVDKGLPHQVVAVARKKDDMHFNMFVIDKQKKYDDEHQVYVFEINKEKARELAKSFVESEKMTKETGKRFYIYEELTKLAGDLRPTYLMVEPMSRQKTGNCYVKELEAGIKFAFWYRYRAQSGNKVKWNYKGVEPHQSSTLKIHEMYTDAAIQRLKLAGYGEKVQNILSKNFQRYKSEKKEIDLANWEKKKAITSKQHLQNQKEYGFFEKLKIRMNRKSVASGELQTQLYSYNHIGSLENTTKINSYRNHSDSSKQSSLSDHTKLALKKSDLLNAKKTLQLNQQHLTK